MSNSLLFLFLQQLSMDQPTQRRRPDLPFLLRRQFVPPRRPRRSPDGGRRRRIPRTLRGNAAVAPRRSGGGTDAGSAVHAASHGGIEGVGGFGFGSQSRRGGGSGGDGVRGSLGVVAAVVERVVGGWCVVIEFVVGEFVAENGFEEGGFVGRRGVVVVFFAVIVVVIGVVIVVVIVSIVDVVLIVIGVVISNGIRKALHQGRSQLHDEIVGGGGVIVSIVGFMLPSLLPQMRRGVVLGQGPGRRQQRRHHLAVDGKRRGRQVGEGGLLILRGGRQGEFGFGQRRRRRIRLGRILGGIRLGNVEFGQGSHPVMNGGCRRRRGRRRARRRGSLFRNRHRPAAIARPSRQTQTVRQQPPRLLPGPPQEGLVVPLPRLFRRRGGRAGRAAVVVGGEGGVGVGSQCRVRGGRRAHRGGGQGDGAGDGGGGSSAALDEGRVGIVDRRGSCSCSGGKSRGRGGRGVVEVEGEVGGEGGVRVVRAVGQEVVAAAAAGEFEAGGGFAADFGRDPFLGTAAHDDDDDDDDGRSAIKDVIVLLTGCEDDKYIKTFQCENEIKCIEVKPSDGANEKL